MEKIQDINVVPIIDKVFGLVNMIVPLIILGVVGNWLYKTA
jgi:hypothetical protein